MPGFALTLAAEISGGPAERALTAARGPMVSKTEIERQRRLQREREVDLILRQRKRGLA